MLMESLAKEFKDIARKKKQEGNIEESRIFKNYSKKLRRFLKAIRPEENEQLIVFLVWLMSQELAEYNIEFSENLRKILLRENGISIFYNMYLSKKELLARENLLKEYDQRTGRNIFMPGGAFSFFAIKLIKTMLSMKKDDTAITLFVLSSLIPESPLRVFIQEGIHLVKETVLDVDIKLVNQLIDDISRICKEDLRKIYRI